MSPTKHRVPWLAICIPSQRFAPGPAQLRCLSSPLDTAYRQVSGLVRPAHTVYQSFEPARSQHSGGLASHKLERAQQHLPPPVSRIAAEHSIFCVYCNNSIVPFSPRSGQSLPVVRALCSAFCFPPKRVSRVRSHIT